MNKLKPHFLYPPKPPPHSASSTSTKSFNSTINRLSSEGAHEEVLLTYASMLKANTPPDAYTFPSLLKACTSLNLFSRGLCFHQHVIVYGYSSDAYIGSSLINFYAKFWVEDVRDLFELMERRDIVSWNSLVSCYAQFGNIGEILNLLSRMRIEGVDPDKQTFGSLVSATAKQSDHDLGQLVHARILTAGFEIDAHVETSLIVMYLKCGNFDNAFRIFERTPDKDVILWTAMISGLVQSECADKAVTLFRCMLLSNILPSTATIASALAACAQLGRVEDAYNFYKTRFSEPAVEVLGILLDACRTRGNLELGDIIAREIFTLKPTDAGNYLQLAHNYASTDRYDGVSEAWIQMRSLGLKKLPGWSFIELNGSITTFFTHHSSHPQNEDIVHVLKFLSKEIRDLGVNVKTDFLNIP
ncbi:tetratricopeptide repeat (TPR)-like superfamily protein [Actinidia rufa]|uniref:Tetratricopeptide repeat (TPR)-like superfamily protein n=1 Tax=Actinidia rufa TaxID=165716 RepID=A0A7J0EZ58_9ERIC|nr:tetratricopeptide repeat (TPR)-like superfamily protein [Actinidia rufa]